MRSSLLTPSFLTPSVLLALTCLLGCGGEDEVEKDEDVGEWLRESSLSHWGVPRGMAEEARDMRKLMAKAHSPQ